MPRDIWVTADTHFQHQNMFTWDCKRAKDFSCAEEADEAMVQRWNEVVKPGDIVYHLGDVMFGSKETFPSLWARLKGRKRLIVGNHDDVKWIAANGFFQKISSSRVFREHAVVFTHIPIMPSSSWGCLNVHGHTHENGAPSNRHKCVSVELTDYRPLHIEELNG